MKIKIFGFLLAFALILAVFSYIPTEAQASPQNVVMFEQQQEAQADPISSLLLFVIVPGGISFVICSAFRAQMKSVHKAREASRYVASNSIVINYHQDRFVHTTVQRTPIPRQNPNNK